MKKLLFGFVLLFSQLNLTAQTAKNYVRYVNPLIGTRKMGHTFPGATVPFGAVQLSPDTDEQPYLIGGKYNRDAYKYCAGYNYDDREIVGFSAHAFQRHGTFGLGRFSDYADDGRFAARAGREKRSEKRFSFGFFSRR